MVGISFFSFILHIQFQLDFFLCLCLKVLYLDRIRDRQGFQILYAEAAQKLFRSSKQDRTSGGIQTPQLPDQTVFYQLVDGVVTFYPSDLLDLRLCNRLFVCNDGLGFQHNI